MAWLQDFHGRVVMVKLELTQVLAAKVHSGQYSLRNAVEFANDILLNAPQALLGMIPAKRV